MKRKLILLALLMVFFCSKAYMQKTHLNVYGNYVFDDNVDSYYSNTSYFNGKIKGGFLWGFGLEYQVQPTSSVELQYLREDTKAPMEYYDGGVKHSELDMAINYLLIGGNTILGGNKKVQPYAGVMLGAAFVGIDNPDNSKGTDVTKFAWGFKLGANLWGDGRVGLKLQTQLLSVPQSVGGGVYFGTGGGGAGVTAVSSIYQFILGGGLVFKLGH